MTTIHLEAATSTPKICLNKDEGIFEISGRSLMENAARFYNPVLDWVSEYVKEPNDETNFVLNIEYLNSSSTKKIVSLIIELEKIIDTGKKVKITWYYDVNDDVMLERGEEIATIIEVPIIFIEVDYDDEE